MRSRLPRRQRGQRTVLTGEQNGPPISSKCGKGVISSVRRSGPQKCNNSGMVCDNVIDVKKRGSEYSRGLGSSSQLHSLQPGPGTCKTRGVPFTKLTRRALQNCWRSAEELAAG